MIVELCRRPSFVSVLEIYPYRAVARNPPTLIPPFSWLGERWRVPPPSTPPCATSPLLPCETASDEAILERIADAQLLIQTSAHTLSIHTPNRWVQHGLELNQLVFAKFWNSDLEHNSVCTIHVPKRPKSLNKHPRDIKILASHLNKYWQVHAIVIANQLPLADWSMKIFPLAAAHPTIQSEFSYSSDTIQMCATECVLNPALNRTNFRIEFLISFKPLIMKCRVLFSFIMSVSYSHAERAQKIEVTRKCHSLPNSIVLGFQWGKGLR